MGNEVFEMRDECSALSLLKAKKSGKNKWRSLFLISHFLFLFLLAIACTEAAVNPEDSVSVMTTFGVNTLISDSGVIKYRIVTERWDVNTVRQPSRWEFMKGVFFEQFDEQFHVQAYIQADTAWYYDQKKLWHLRGRVRIRNIMNGLIYQSEELFWDGIKHELYSNVFSKVTTPERSMEGTRFLSDEQMRHYTVSNSKGSFEREDMTGENREEEKPQTNPADTISQEPQFMRPQAQKHRKSDI